MQDGPRMVQKIQHIPYKIGITGTIASGKSLVGKILEGQGIPVLDTDVVVKTLYTDDDGLKQAIAKQFGPQVLNPDGTVNKKVLGGVVFADALKRKALESLVHPLVRKKVEAFLNNPVLQSPFRAVLVPLLFENQLESMYDEVWTIVVQPESELVKRLMTREQISREEAQKRLSAQWSQAQKMQNATRIIDNSGTPDETRARILDALSKVQGGLQPSA